MFWRINFVIFCVILFCSSKAISNDFEIYDCDKEKKKIYNILKIFPDCEIDDDCRYFDFGYPWQSDVCNKAIISKSQEKKNLKYLSAIEKYNQNCIFINDDEKKKFEDFNQDLQKSECNNLPRLFCLKSVCRNQYYPLIFDDVDSLR